MSKTFALIALSGFLFIQEAFSQLNIADVKLDNKQSVLNGRAYFNFPAAAENKERPSDLMSAGRNPNEETRIIYEVGKMRLVFFAQELYMLGGKNLFNDVSHDSAYIKNFTTKIFSATDSLITILSTPLRYDTSQAGIVINSLLVQTYDGTIFRLDAYINSAAITKREQFQALTEKIFKTIIAGYRTNKIKERNEKYFFDDSSKAFVFHLPFNYCVTVDNGDDFKVFKFHRFNHFTDTGWAALLIYVGDYPSYMFMNYGLDEASAIKDSGTFLDQKVQWLIFKDDMQGLYLKEQIIPERNTRIGGGEVIHVAMMSNSKGMFPELTGIIEAVKITGK
jgi:hypothetical protein